jgi:NAD(P)-dependent dehydrogenase (short-subunit alcohol dehydrogenase family)
MAKYTSTILITGGTQGLGYHTALSLAQQCPTSLLVLASRTDPDNAATLINTTLKQSNVKYMPLDLSSFANIRAFVRTWNEATDLPPISALILNAGVQFPGAVEYTTDGIEKHFGINHVGHALLFHLLAPKLTSDARIVVVSSGTHDPIEGGQFGFKPHYTTPEAVAKPDAEATKKYNGRDRYATSKTANNLWASALGSHLSASPSHASKTVVAFDPGLMFGTNFTREAGWFLRMLNRQTWMAPTAVKLMRRFMYDNVNMPAESGVTMAWLVTGEEVKGKKGVYLQRRKEVEASEVAREVEKQEELWRWTVERVGENGEEKKRFASVE